MKCPAQDSNRQPQRLKARTLTATLPSPQEGTVIAIPKPGKDSKNLSNYRPISMTSCLCKTIERMINTRLVWFLEKNNILTKYQSGFRKGRTTTDQLIRLESFIRDSLVKGNHVVAVFFYLEKAYDTV